MVQHHLDPKKIAEQPEETWLRPADWETYHSKVQEIVVDVEPADINDLLMDSGKEGEEKGENNNEVIHLSSSTSRGSEEEHSEGGEEYRKAKVRLIN